MKVKAKRLFCSPVYGNVKEGDVITVPESFAKQLADIGLVELETKQQAPKKAPSKKAK